MATTFVSVDDLEKALGEQFKRLRLDQDIDQRDLAERAGVSWSSLKSLEGGKGSTLATIVKVARALGKVDWIESFYPIPEISPMELLRAQEASKGPQRASNSRTRAHPKRSTPTEAAPTEPRS